MLEPPPGRAGRARGRRRGSADRVVGARRAPSSTTWRRGGWRRRTGRRGGERMIERQLEAAREGNDRRPGGAGPDRVVPAQWLNQWPRKLTEPSGERRRTLLPAGLWADLAEPGPASRRGRSGSRSRTTTGSAPPSPRSAGWTTAGSRSTAGRAADWDAAIADVERSGRCAPGPGAAASARRCSTGCRPGRCRRRRRPAATRDPGRARAVPRPGRRRRCSSTTRRPASSTRRSRRRRCGSRRPGWC